MQIFYLFSTVCRLPLGMQSYGINNDQISASSEENSNRETWKNSARLNCEYAWRAGKNNAGEYIQVDLGQITNVSGINIQGDHADDRYVTSFLVKSSNNGVDWTDTQVNTISRGGRRGDSDCKLPGKLVVFFMDKNQRFGIFKGFS